MSGSIRTGSYTNRDNQKVYTTDVIVEECDFAESKKQQESQNNGPSPYGSGDGFMDADLSDSRLPFD